MDFHAVLIESKCGLLSCLKDISNECFSRRKSSCYGRHLLDIGFNLNLVWSRSRAEDPSLMDR